MTKRPFSPPLPPLLHAYLAEQARWQRLTAVCARHTPPPCTPPTTTNPYRPLTPFSQNDAPLFFGRAPVTQRLIAAVSSQPVVALLGESGSGKTSLIHAGLLPQLDTATWHIVVVTLDKRPFLALAHALLHQLPQPHSQHEASQLATALANQTISLSDLLARLNSRTAHPKRWLLIIDQLEATLTPEFTKGAMPATTALLDHFLGSLSSNSGALVTLLLTLRSDALGAALRYPPLAIALYGHDIPLTPLSPAALSRASEQPAARHGIFLENGLLERLRDDLAAEPSNLPLLQLTLSTLWEGRNNGRLTHQTYDTHGTASGILAHHATASLAQLPPAVQPAALNLLRQLAANPSPLPIATLTEANWDWVQSLIQARLLVSSEDNHAQPVIQLATPTLLTSWPPLQPTNPPATSQPTAKPLPPDPPPAATKPRRHLSRYAALLALLLIALSWFSLANLRRSDQAAQATTAAVVAQATVEVEIARAVINEAEQAAASETATPLLAETLLAFTPDETLLLAYETVTQARAAGNTPPAAAVARLYQALLQSVNQGVLLGHSGWVTQVTYSPDGQKLLTVGGDTTARIWAADGRLLATLDSHTGWVTSATFSPDGRTVLTTSDDGTARLWDIADTVGQQRQVFDGHDGGIETAVFSPDGQQIVTVGGDGYARIWQLDGTLVAALEHLAGVSAVAFSPDGSQLATGSSDGQLWLWDVNGRPQDVVSGHTGRIHAITYAPDGNSLATGSSDGTLRLWNRNGDSLGIIAGHTDAIWSVAFNPSGSQLLTASSDGTARLWNLEGDVLAIFRHNSWVATALFDQTGERIITGDGNGVVRLWQFDGTLLGEFVGHSDAATALALAPNGLVLASSSRDGTARLWRLDEAATTVLARMDDWVTQTAVSPDGLRLAVAGRNGVVSLWDRDGQQVAQMPGHTAAITALAFSADGRFLVSSSHDATARLWTSDGAFVAALSGHEDAIETAVFSPDSSQLLTGSADGTARLWDLAGTSLVTLADNGGTVQAVAFAGARLVTAGADGQVRLWEKDGRLLHTLGGHTAPVLALASSPNGNQFASASQDGTARLWDAEGTLLATLTGHSDWVNDIVFRPDGGQLLTASSDGTARLWGLDGTPLTVLSGHTGLLFSARFNQDGGQIVTASRDGTARLWSGVGEPLLRLDGHQGVVETAVFDPQSSFVLTGSRDGTARRWPIYANLDMVLGEVEARLRPLLNACTPTNPCTKPSE